MAHDPRAVGANTVHQSYVAVTGVVDQLLVDQRANPDKGWRSSKRQVVGKIPSYNKNLDAEYEVRSGELVVVHKSRKQGKTIDGQKAVVAVSSFANAPMYTENPEDVLDECVPVGIAFRDANLEQGNAAKTIANQTFAIQVGGSFDVVNHTLNLPVGARLRWGLDEASNHKAGGLSGPKQRLVPKPETDGQPFSMRIYKKFADYYQNKGDLNKHEAVCADALENFAMLAFAAGLAAQANGDLQAQFQRENNGKDFDINNGANLFKSLGGSDADAHRKFIMRLIFAKTRGGEFDSRSQLTQFQGSAFAGPEIDRGLVQWQMDAAQKLFECFSDCVRADNAYVFGTMIEGVPSGHKGMAII